MYLIISDCTNPYFNLATEEYLLKHTDNNYCFFYRNSPSIICGKHQIPYKEINIHYVKANNIKICRRLSGGGTVYHDEGNINFSFIQTSKFEDEQIINFKHFIEPIAKFLTNKMQVNAVINERNNIIVNHQKISGNAEHISKNRILHHGTLLYDSCLNDINQSIRKNNSQYTDKSVPSVNANVGNIADYIKHKVAISTFQNELTKFVSDFFSCVPYTLNENDIREINKLVDNKYQTENWIYGYSPKYKLQNTFKLQENTYTIKIDISSSIIEKISIYGKNTHKFEEIMKLLQNAPHIYENITERLALNSAFAKLDKSTQEQIIENLF